MRHLLSKVRGRFSDFAGTIEFDESNPQNSRVDVTIQARSIDTAEGDRDKHLRSADFFDVDTYPTLTFTSTSVTPRGGNTYDVAGNLTIHGVTRPSRCPRAFSARAGSLGQHEVRLRGGADAEPQGFRPVPGTPRSRPEGFW